MNNQRARFPIALVAGLSLAGTLAGCSAAADGEETPSTDTSSSSSNSTGSTAAAGSYADGEYSEDATYQSPDGTEEISVTVTLADGIITAVEVTGNGDNPNSKRYQGEFADGIADVVVGKSIDEISVNRVAGSSLTSAGFTKAIDEIKADAAG